MRVAVITPYYKEPHDILSQCHESVMRQRHESLHVMIAAKALGQILHTPIFATLLFQRCTHGLV